MRLFFYIFLLINIAHADINQTTACQSCISKYDLNALYRNSDNIKNSLNSKISYLEKTFPEKEKSLELLKETILQNHKTYQDNYTILLEIIAFVSAAVIIIGGAWGYIQHKELNSLKKQFQDEMNDELQYIRNMFNEIYNSSNSAITQSRLDFLQTKQEMLTQQTTIEERSKQILLKIQEDGKEITILLKKAEKALEPLELELTKKIEKFEEGDSKLESIIEKKLNNDLEKLIKKIIKDMSE